MQSLKYFWMHIKKNDTNRLQAIEISIDAICIISSMFWFLFLIWTRQECLCQGPNRNLHSGQQLLRSEGIELLHLRPQNRVAETSSFDATFFHKGQLCRIRTVDSCRYALGQLGSSCKGLVPDMRKSCEIACYEQVVAKRWQANPLSLIYGEDRKQICVDFAYLRLSGNMVQSCSINHVGFYLSMVLHDAAPWAMRCGHKRPTCTGR